MSFIYDYISDVAARDGADAAELRRSMRCVPITDAQAQARGYDTADAYLDALHQFLNEQ